MKAVEKFYKDKNILVTGGTGFIGSHLVEKLIELKAKVTILDNLSTGNINNLRNVFSLVNIIYGDITNQFTTINATRNKDIVFHLAAFVSVKGSIQNPKSCNKINIDGTKNLLEGCKKNNIKSFVFSSSAATYGSTNKKCKEKDVLKPLSPYATSKVEGEKLCKKYFQEYKINTVILRYFNVYGPRQNPNGEYAAAVAKFKYNLENKKPLTIFGDGKQTRDFIHVSDVVKANLQLGTQGLKGEIFNVASGKSINLLELIKKLENETKTKNVEILFEPARKGDILFSSANCEKYQKLIKLHF